MTIDDYIVLADIPKIQVESEEELPGLRWRNQSPSPSRGQEVRNQRLVNNTSTVFAILPHNVCLVQTCKSFFVPLKRWEIATN